MTQLSQLRKSGAFAVAFFARVLIRATFVLGTTLVVIWLLTTPAQAEQRVALLIGNAAYQSSPLSNPPNDVREMEAALKAVGFKVDKVLNANQNTMKRAVRDFGDKAQGADIALLYYSGHGTQAAGENYLIPVGAAIHKEADYSIEAIAANDIMRQIAGARPRAAIVVLDACRDNPYANATRGGPKGLTRMDAPTRTMVAFATAPNTTASDEGLYAKVLAKQIKTPGLELIDVFRNTTDEVLRQSHGKQEPRISEMSITERIYLAGRAGPETQVASLEPLAAPAYQPPAVAPTPRLSSGQVIQECPDCPKMVVIPAGNFIMGSSAQEQAEAEAQGAPKAGQADESPAHSVSVGSFLLGQTDVTIAQWRAFARASGYTTDAERNAGGGKGCRTLELKDVKWYYREGASWKNPGWAVADDQPVVCISWNDANEYAKWLSQTTGQHYSLPNEAQWEYAARSNTVTSRYWGDDPNQACYYANGTDQTAFPDGSGRTWSKKAECNDGYFYVSPVGHYRPNAFGLYDMLGNVWQWTQDVYHDNYNGAPSDGSAWTSGGNQGRRVLRGGPWNGYPGYLRSAIRGGGTPDDRNSNLGLRIARTL